MNAKIRVLTGDFSWREFAVKVLIRLPGRALVRVPELEETWIIGRDGVRDNDSNAVYPAHPDDCRALVGGGPEMN